MHSIQHVAFPYIFFGKISPQQDEEHNHVTEL